MAHYDPGNKSWAKERSPAPLRPGSEDAENTERIVLEIWVCLMADRLGAGRRYRDRVGDAQSGARPFETWTIDRILKRAGVPPATR